MLDELDDGLMPDILDRFPLTANWEITAQLSGCTPRELLVHALVTPITFNLLLLKAKDDQPEMRGNVTMIPGHMAHGGYGPAPADIMVVGKMPGFEEINKSRYFVGESGNYLRAVMERHGLSLDAAFVSNVAHYPPPGVRKGELLSGVVKDCAPLLLHELLYVRPKYLLLLGADPIKFMFGKTANLSNTRGAVLPFVPYRDIGRFPEPMSGDAGIVLDSMATAVVTSNNPAYVLREPETAEAFERDIALFAKVVHGQRTQVRGLDTAIATNYLYIQDAKTLTALVDQLIAEGHTEFAVDCEWGGKNYLTGWLRTVQFSWAKGAAAVVILRSQASQRSPVFDGGGIFAAIEQLRRLLLRPGIKLIGHNFRSDGLWLEDLGLPAMHPEHFKFDTMLAAHVINETQDLDLTSVAMRYSDMPRWDTELTRYVKLHKSPDGGYGHVPDEILHPYGAGDADAEWRTYHGLQRELDQPGMARQRHLFYTIIMPANAPIHQIERNGMLVDTDRMVDNLWFYDGVRKQQLLQLRELLGQPDFNPRSPQGRIKFLFGAESVGGLGLTPIKTTGKPAREWADLARLPEAERKLAQPATDAETVKLLMYDIEDPHKRKALQLFSDFTTLDQINKGFLRPPSGPALEDDPKDLTLQAKYDPALFTTGLLGYISPDGRLRTSISQTKETGRHGSSRPNLQNLSKKMEAVYQLILESIFGKGYKRPKMRSCIVARPGYVLIEADYKSAELVALGYISGDETLIADATGPVKLHAKVAVDVLRAPCSYAEVAEAYPNLYVGAKNLSFGIPYQRGPKAIARQINRETNGAAHMTPDLARELIDAWYERYAMVAAYVEWCKQCVREAPHTIFSPWGRCRHFYESPDESVMAKQERECVNFPIQSTIADALNRTLFNLWAYQQLCPEIVFYILMAIHDAVLLEVPIEFVERMVEEVIPLCMSQEVEIPATERSKAFQLGVDTDVTFRWGETPSREECQTAGVPEQYWPKEKKPKKEASKPA